MAGRNEVVAGVIVKDIVIYFVFYRQGRKRHYEKRERERKKVTFEVE